MPALLHPGVYVREIPSGVRSIEGAATSTAIFVGETERGPVGPTRITGRSEYDRLFGGYFRARDRSGDAPQDPTRVLTTYAIDGFFLNGGTTAYILRAMDSGNDRMPAEAIRGDVIANSPGIWGNDLSVAFLASSDQDSSRFRLVVVYKPPGPGATKAIVENWDRLSTDSSDESYVVDVLQRSLYVRWDPEAVPPTRPDLDEVGSPPTSTAPEDSDIVAGAVALTGGTGGGGPLESSDYAELLADRLAGVDDAALVVACPDALLINDDPDGYVELVNVFTGFAETRPRQDLFFIGDLPAQRTSDATTATTATTALMGSGALMTSTFAALYWPHVVVSDPVGVGRNPTLVIPPAGHVAGMFARTDARRGVWKAPAGTEATLNGTLALGQQLTDLHSDALNPKGINALRQMPSAGRVVWGSRTLVPSSEWRYVSVRRVAIFLRTSIYFGIQWAVFEPNDTPLWGSLRSTIGGFMQTQFRNGAFAGRTSDEAYFVKCDADTTTPIDQAAGVVNILVGFAPLRPAEFVVVQLSQKAQALS